MGNRANSLLLKKVLVLSTISVAGYFFWHQRTLLDDDVNVYSPKFVKTDSKINKNSLSESVSALLNAKHKFPGNFNLVEDASKFTGALSHPPKTCSLGLMNGEGLQQDHPCVLNNIRKHFLEPPSTKPLNLDYPEVEDPSDGQTEAVMYLLNNKTNGFFIECGALDGENLSNTLYLERYFNWTGLLVEADQEVFKTLLSKNRKSWASSACLSDDPYPREVTFRAIYAQGQVDSKKVPIRDTSGQTGTAGRVSTVQCFPLYSILLAIGQTQIDYFSLDVEQHEIFILKTIPFDKVNITVLSVETFLTKGEQPQVYEDLVDYMKQQGYELVHMIDMGLDVLFVKSDYLTRMRAVDPDFPYGGPRTFQN